MEGLLDFVAEQWNGPWTSKILGAILLGIVVAKSGYKLYKKVSWRPSQDDQKSLFNHLASLLDSSAGWATLTEGSIMRQVDENFTLRVLYKAGPVPAENGRLVLGMSVLPAGLYASGSPGQDWAKIDLCLNNGQKRKLIRKARKIAYTLGQETKAARTKALLTRFLASDKKEASDTKQMPIGSLDSARDLRRVLEGHKEVSMHGVPRTIRP